MLRDGRRNSNREGIDEIDLGFGLRNPDFDDSNPETKLNLKPRKTIIFFPTNLYLHALSAETSEELWAYIAHDQLDKIVAMMTGTPTRDPHIYTHAASVRLVDVFVPGTTGCLECAWSSATYDSLEISQPCEDDAGAAPTNAPTARPRRKLRTQRTS